MSAVDTCSATGKDGNRCPCRRYVLPPDSTDDESKSLDCFSCEHMESAHPTGQLDKQKTTSHILSKYGITVKSTGTVTSQSSSSSKASTKKKSPQTQETEPLVSEDEARAEVNSTLSEKKAGGTSKNRRKKNKVIINTLSNRTY